MPSSGVWSVSSSDGSSAKACAWWRPSCVRSTKRPPSEHYEEHHGKPFYGDLVGFITRSPAMVLVVEGPEDTWSIVRTMMGPTNPAEAPPGTIRGDLGTLLTENLVHGSDSADSAAREIAIFFPGLT